MAGLELIIAALAAGAGAGVKDTASAAVKDAYTKLKELLVRQLASRGRTAQVIDAEVLDGEVVDSAGWQTRLGQDLTASGAVTDPQVLTAARRLLELLDAAGVRAGKYQVDASQAKGVQVGDHGTQNNTFN